MTGTKKTRPIVLLTGFEPFGGETINPAREVANALDGALVRDHRIISAILPVAFAGTSQRLDDLIARHRPSLVLALGQAGGRSRLSLERVAINLIDARIADNDGAQPIDETIIAGAPGAYFSTLPLKAIEARLCELGIPAELSLSAGSFVCNQAFFLLAHLLAAQRLSVRGGFVHLPWLPQQAARLPDQPSMALDAMIAGIRATLECALTTHEDARRIGGATH